jgi:hypothetical protein
MLAGFVIRSILLGVLALVLPLASCGDTLRGKSLSEAAIADFHATYNAGDFKELYRQLDDRMKTEAPEADFLGLMEHMRHALGAWQSSTNSSWNVNTRNLATVAVVTKASRFEHGSGTETFTYSVSHGAVKMLGYYIKSKELEPK